MADAEAIEGAGRGRLGAVGGAQHAGPEDEVLGDGAADEDAEP